MDNNAILFIPDISGFTKFVTETEIKHSNHIISELIETIINSNELELKISEVEGDAVLFYKIGDIPSVEEILDQAKKIFIKFHTHLKIIERDSVCQCGACTTASNLTLKFITHLGELQEVVIKNFNKLMGSDVILAHRLLKNSIPNHEYILFTEKYLTSSNFLENIHDEWIKIISHSDEYAEFGSVNSKYITLTPLRNFIKIPKTKEELNLNAKPVELEININVPLKVVHCKLIDENEKIKWVRGLNEVIGASEINRIGSSHICVFDFVKITFTTIQNKVENNKITFIEKGETNLGLTIIFNYLLTEKDGLTNILLRLSPEKPNKLFTIMLNTFKSREQKNLESFKAFCESIV